MNLEKSIYPYNPEAQKLPLFLSGIGGSNFQKEIVRPQGYHWHQILFCTAGNGIIEYAGTSKEIHPGDFIFLPKNIPHHYYPLAASWGVCWLTFEGSNCDEILEKLQLTEPCIITPPEDSHLEKIFEKMVNSLETDFLYCDYICSGLLYEFIIKLHRYSTSSADSERSKLISLIMPVLRYMHDNYNKDVSMAELSSLIDVTPEHFSRIFKKAMNTTPTIFLTNIRINEAKRMLSQAGTPISLVAKETGFNDPNYFCTVFRKYVGTSPSEYQKQVTNITNK